MLCISTYVILLYYESTFMFYSFFTLYNYVCVRIRKKWRPCVFVYWDSLHFFSLVSLPEQGHSNDIIFINLAIHMTPIWQHRCRSKNVYDIMQDCGNLFAIWIIKEFGKEFQWQIKFKKYTWSVLFEPGHKIWIQNSYTCSLGLAISEDAK